MVDVGDKESTSRRAVATGCITMEPATLAQVIEGEHKKGDVLGIARIAGIMAAKKTPELIPLCHTILITSVAIEFETDRQSNAITCSATVKCNSQTGVEMEALTAVQIALLTIYDMCKAVDRGMLISNIGVSEKSGGKSGNWTRDES